MVQALVTEQPPHRRQYGRVGRAPDLKFVGRGLKSHSDHYLMLFSVAPSSTSQLRL